MKFGINESGGKELLSIDVISTEGTEGWLSGELHFQQSGFSVHFQLSIMANDIYSFKDQLIVLNNTLKGSATFENIEHNVRLTMTVNSQGHIEVKGRLTHPNIFDLETTFAFESDQTFLLPLLQSVNYILQNYKSLP